MKKALQLATLVANKLDTDSFNEFCERCDMEYY